MSQDDHFNEEESEEITAEELAELRKAKEELDTLKPEYEKIKDKDHNFEELRKAKEAKEEKIREGETKYERLEREQKEKLEEIEGQNRKWREDQFSESKEDFFKNMCGDDKELREKIEFEMEQLKGEVNTTKQLKEKMEKAHLLVKGTRPEPSVFGNLATTSSGQAPKKRSFTDTEDGKAILKKITKGQVDIDKLSKKRDTYFDL